MVLEAQKCLIEEKGIWKRANQKVTMKNGHKLKDMEVSPHLKIYTSIWNGTHPTKKELTKSIQEAFDVLQPIYSFVKNQCANKKTS